MAKSKGLGRGLDALFSDNAFDDNNSTPASTLKIFNIEPNKDQPRKIFDEEAISDLASSISKHGLIQPIIVRPKSDGIYEIVAGERRWRACKLAGIIDVPVIIRDFDDITTAQIALIENLQREDLNPIEEAVGYKKLIEEYGFTQEVLSENIGKSRSSIANTLRLLNLPESVIGKVRSNELSSGHARTLLSIIGEIDEKSLTELVENIIKNDISVRALEKIIKDIKSGKTNDPHIEDIVMKEYYSHIEKKISDNLCRKVKLSNKNLTISFSDNDDLENFIKKLCGNDIFND